MSRFKLRPPMGLVFSALLLASSAAFAQAGATAPAKPTGYMHHGMMDHDETSGMKHGDMKHGDMKGGMKSSCMSKAGMQKMGMSQKKMAQMGSMGRAEKKRGVAPAVAKPKPPL